MSQEFLNQFGTILAEMSAGVSSPPLQDGFGLNTKLSLPDLIASLFSEGRKKIGPGYLIVPKDVDFELGETNSPTKLSVKVTRGWPKFEGDLFLRLVKLNGKLTGIEMDGSLRKGTILIDGLFDVPFWIDREY